MRRALIVLVSGLSLSGCAVQRAQEACLAYGYQPDTLHYAACVQTEVQAFNSRLMAFGAGLSAQGAAMSQPAYGAPSVHTYTFGGQTTTCTMTKSFTNCY